jgi:hypothetical protein
MWLIVVILGEVRKGGDYTFDKQVAFGSGHIHAFEFYEIRLFSVSLIEYLIHISSLKHK